MILRGDVRRQQRLCGDARHIHGAPCNRTEKPLPHAIDIDPHRRMSFGVAPGWQYTTDERPDDELPRTEPDRARRHICRATSLSVLLVIGCADANPAKPDTLTDAHLADVHHEFQRAGPGGSAA